jgi:hypothetical protein
MHSAPASPSTDVFALAVTLNELSTLTPPYSDCTRDGPPGLHTVLDRGYTRQQLAAAVAGEGLRPRFPPTACPPGWTDLLDAAWATDPAQRPSASTMIYRLQRLLEDVLPSWDPAARLRPAVSSDLPDATMMDAAWAAAVAQAETHGAGGRGMLPDTADDGTTKTGSRVICDALKPRLSHVAPMSPLCSPRASEPAHKVHGFRDDQLAAVKAAQAAAYVTEDEREEAAMVAGLALAAKHCDKNAWSNELAEAGARLWDCATGTAPTHPLSQQSNMHYLPTVSAGVVEAVGARDSWEDRSVVIPALELPAEAQLPPVALLAVFDGHRGAAAADFCARRLPALAKELLASASNITAADGTACKSGTDEDQLAGIMRTLLLTLEQGKVPFRLKLSFGSMTSSVVNAHCARLYYPASYLAPQSTLRSGMVSAGWPWLVLPALCQMRTSHRM